MAQCGTCMGQGVITEEKVMAVTSQRTGITYTETVPTQKPCPGGCNNGQVPDTGSR